MTTFRALAAIVIVYLERDAVTVVTENGEDRHALFFNV